MISDPVVHLPSTILLIWFRTQELSNDSLFLFFMESLSPTFAFLFYFVCVYVYGVCAW